MLHREVTARLEAWRLLLFIICLENQGNDSSNEHAELKNPFPCNIHTCHELRSDCHRQSFYFYSQRDAPPLSYDWGQRSITPEKNRGEPPTGVLPAAPETAYHKIRQIARKTPVRVVRKYPTQQNAPAAQYLRRRGLSFTFSPNRPASRCLSTR